MDLKTYLNTISSGQNIIKCIGSHQELVPGFLIGIALETFAEHMDCIQDETVDEYEDMTLNPIEELGLLHELSVTLAKKENVPANYYWDIVREMTDFEIDKHLDI